MSNMSRRGFLAALVGAAGAAALPLPPFADLTGEIHVLCAYDELTVHKCGFIPGCPPWPLDEVAWRDWMTDTNTRGDEGR